MAAASNVPQFNEFLDLLNGGTIDDENTLAKAFAGEIVKKKRDKSEVQAAVYRPQKYYRRNDSGEISFYVAWTLFVAWIDGTTTCWMNARDVLRGVGYDTIHVKDFLEKYITGGDGQFVSWGEICSYILQFNPHRVLSGTAPRSGGSGWEAANAVKTTTLFLTEQGVIELHQQAPKCKAFRNSIANFLMWIRSNLTKNFVFVSRERLETLEKGVAAAALTDATYAEKDREIAELRDSLSRAKEEARTLYEKELERLRVKHDETVKDMSRILADETRRIDAQKADHAREVARMRQERRTIVADLKMLRRKGLEYFYQIRKMNSAMNRCNFLYFDPLTIKPRERLVCCLVYVGQCLAVPENVWRNCLLCIRGQRKHVQATLRKLYIRNSDSLATVTMTNNKTLNRMIENGELKLDEEHLYDPDRLDALGTLFDLNCDSRFNAVQHKRILVDTINSVLLMRIPRRRRKGLQNNDSSDDADVLINFDAPDLSDPRSFPFRQYGGFQNSNVYVCSKYFPDVELAFNQFDLYAERFGSVEALGLRLELIDSIFQDSRAVCSHDYSNDDDDDDNGDEDMDVE